MNQFLPFPILTAFLLVVWLLLSQSLWLGNFLLGAVTAVVAGWIFTALEPPRTRIVQAGAALRLLSLVLADIVRSNVAVARIILGLVDRERTSDFVNIPLELRDPYGLAALACIITATPGTLWVNFDSGKGILTIHVLDLIDEREWMRTIKGRYERLLLDIFE
jgi:multicomponent K+:H+ antiporter subunit E